jgi:hypothetical protein
MDWRIHLWLGISVSFALACTDFQEEFTKDLIRYTSVEARLTSLSFKF